MSIYKITNKHLDDKFLKYLTLQGSKPAFAFLAYQLNRQPAKRKDINIIKKNAKKRNPDIKFEFDSIAAIKEKKNLMSIKREIQNFPMRALINPWNNDKLNIKLSEFDHTKKIKKYSFGIGANNLSHRGVKFTSADLNNIRQSIIWLNWFTYDIPKISRPARNQLCISPTALSIVISSDLNELYKYARYEKKILKKYFNLFPEKKSHYVSFLSSASVELGELFAHRIPENQINNLIRSYEYFIDSGNNIMETNHFPNYYMYNPLIIKKQKNLRLLFELGYNRMINMKFLQRENLPFLNKIELYEALSKNFSSLSL